MQSVMVRPDSICIHNDSLPAPKMISQVDFSVFGDVTTNSKEPENPVRAKKPVVQTSRQPLQVLATNPDCSGLNDSGDSYGNTSLFGAHTAKIEFEPPAASTRNLRPMLQHIREQGGFKQTRMFSPNERPLHTIIDDSLELSSAGIDPPPVAKDKEAPIAGSSCWKGGESVIVEGFEKSAIKHSLPDNSIKLTDIKAEISQFGLTEPIPRDMPDIANHSAIVDPSTYRLQTKRIKGSSADEEALTYDYDYMDIVANKSAEDHLENKESMIIPDILINDQTAEQLGATEEKTEQDRTYQEVISEVQQQEKIESNILSRNDQSIKFFYQICYEPSILSESSTNKSAIKNAVDYGEQLNEMSILMQKQLSGEHDELNVPEPFNQKTADLNKLRITFNHGEIANPMLAESMLADETFSGGGNNMNMSSLSGQTTKTVPLNDTIVKSVQNPFNFDTKNRLINRGAIEYLKKKPNYASVMVKGPMVREKANVAIKEPYKVISEIGNGAYAKIYLIEPVKQDKDKRKQLALKVTAQRTTNSQLRFHGN